ncbi:MAG: transketolase [Pelagibacterales bacterium]|nr:transketolase [Pelagibacterales bacterium]
MKLEKSKIKLWSNIGSRATFGLVALELAKSINDLMILTSDVSTSAGLDRFKAKFPDKYLDVGIAEQNLIGVAAGLSSEGMNVFTTTFSPFQTMRCCEQIKVNLGYMKHKVVLVGLASGLVLGTLGYTHCSIEDISIMRSIPNITVLSPADCGETVKAIYAAAKHDSSVYLRLTGGTNNKIVYNDDYDFKIGKPVLVKEGDDVILFATGIMVYNCIEAAKILESKSINVKVINIHTIKPFDDKSFRIYCKNSKYIFSVEEHSIIGGLGSAIAESNTKLQDAPKHIFIGLPDKYGPGGTYDFLLKKYSLTPEQIADRVLSEI